MLNLQSTKHQSLETNLLDIEEDDTYAGELKLVDGIEMLLGETLLGLLLFELVCEASVDNAWLDAQSAWVPTTFRPFSFMRSLILVRT